MRKPLTVHICWVSANTLFAVYCLHTLIVFCDCTIIVSRQTRNRSSWLTISLKAVSFLICPEPRHSCCNVPDRTPVYPYDPSKAAPILFAVFFLISTIIHTHQTLCAIPIEWHTGHELTPSVKPSHGASLSSYHGLVLSL